MAAIIVTDLVCVIHCRLPQHQNVERLFQVYAGRNSGQGIGGTEELWLDHQASYPVALHQVVLPGGALDGHGSYNACLTLMALACVRVHGGEPERVSPSPHYVRIGHYQCICRQGDFNANLATIVKGLELAANARLDIVSFPEAMLTGYFACEADAPSIPSPLTRPKCNSYCSHAQFDALFMVGFTEQREGKLYDTVAVIESDDLQPGPGKEVSQPTDLAQSHVGHGAARSCPTC